MHMDVQEILLDEARLAELTDEISAKINRDYSGEPVLAVVVMKGSLIFAADLIRKLDLDVSVDFMQASSYGVGSESSGTIKIKKDLESDVTGKNVLIIEDIADSGRTLSLLKKEIAERGAKTVRIASLLSKPARRVVDVELEYVGTDIPDEFVVGYGLDFAEKYRNLPYVGILKPEVYR